MEVSSTSATDRRYEIVVVTLLASIPSEEVIDEVDMSISSLHVRTSVSELRSDREIYKDARDVVDIAGHA